MSRAFVKDDSGQEPEPRYSLPEPDSPYYAEASAWALIEGADAGDSRSAELATGYTWGDRRLVPHVKKIHEQARDQDQSRIATLARRFLRAAGEPRP
jgi:hypothetical protein